MDRIIVKSNADMQRVLDWAEELRGLTVKLPFPEGEIEFMEEVLTLKFRDMGAPVVRFELWVQGRRVAEWLSNLETREMTELHIAGDGDMKIRLSLVIASDNTLGKCVGKFRAIMLFAAYYREEVMRTRDVQRVAAESDKPGKKRSATRRLTIRRYTIGEEMLSELPAPRRVWTGYAESFGVRGHYRRYKSGKVVWVRPYEKKGRSELKGEKEYIL